MANTTLRYQEVGAQGLRPFRSMGTGKRGEVLGDFTFLHISNWTKIFTVIASEGKQSQPLELLDFTSFPMANATLTQ